MVKLALIVLVMLASRSVIAEDAIENRFVCQISPQQERVILSVGNDGSSLQITLAERGLNIRGNPTIADFSEKGHDMRAYSLQTFAPASYDFTFIVDSTSGEARLHLVRGGLPLKCLFQE